jgi:uncharacterized membrane protein
VTRQRASLVAICLSLVALALRLWGIGERTFAHPENFVPGIDMPDWVNHPPERLTATDILRGTLVDGHPPTYFLVLLPWVKTFGTSLVSLRMPSALLGAASVWLLFLVGRRLHGDRVALVAAALLALHGFNIYWGQLARMYVPTAFLMLLSTLWLLKSLEDGRLRSHVVYVVVTAIALWTQLYAWPVTVAQALWIATRLVSAGVGASMARTVTLAFAVGAPVIQLALYQNPATRWNESAAQFLRFGNLYPTQLPFWNGQPWHPPAAVLLVLCIALMVAALPVAARSSESIAVVDPNPGVERRWLWVDWAIAAMISAGMYLLSWRAFGLSKTNLVVSALPLILVGIGRVILLAASWLRAHPLAPNVRSAMSRVPLAVVLAVVPVGIMALVSVGRGVFVHRGTVVFLPYLVLTVAVGISGLIQARPIALRIAGAAAALAVAVMWGASIPFAYAASSSPRDYAGLARAIEPQIRPGDLILAREDYGIPPFFYYLPRKYDSQLIHLSRTDSTQRAKQLAVLRDAPVGARIWLPRFCAYDWDSDVIAALRALVPLDVIAVQGAELILLTKPAQPDSTVWRLTASQGTLGCETPLVLTEG